MQSLNQNKRFLGTRKFTFRDDNTLLVEHKNWRHQIQYMVDVVALSDKCGHRFVFSKYALGVFGILLGLTLILHLLSILDAFNHNGAIFHGRNIFIGITFIGLLGIFVSIRHERTFKTRNSNVPVLWIFSSNPDYATCSAFIEKIQQRIQARSEFLDLSEQQQSAGELKTLRRLFDDKIISEKVYEQAKARLLK